jgi:hypothetical protein
MNRQHGLHAPDRQFRIGEQACLIGEPEKLSQM